MQDIVIIGGGIIGCSIARELSKYKVSITVIEKMDDVASGISKANSGIVHAGYNEKKGTLKAKLTLEGNHLYDALSKELDFSFQREGALILAFDEEEHKKLFALKENGEALGMTGLQMLSKEEALALEPNLSSTITSALFVKDSGIINPYETTIALAENASINGVEFLFQSKVIGVECLENEGFRITLHTGQTIDCHLLINAAGLFSEEIAQMLSLPTTPVTPVKGEYCLFNAIAGQKVKRTIFQVPSETTKGVLITPTTEGQLIVGPNAVLSSDKEDTSTHKEDLISLLKTAEKSVPGISPDAMLTTFAGLRPRIASGDFIIDDSELYPGFISLFGIDSPGLTAAPAIALHVVELVATHLTLEKKEDFIATRKHLISFMELTKEERNELIHSNPAYGRVVCKCENITEGEIIASIHRPVGARSVDAVKRRTRATLGGCQGTGCLLPISKIISRELGIELSEVMKNNKGSNAIGY